MRRRSRVASGGGLAPFCPDPLELDARPPPLSPFDRPSRMRSSGPPPPPHQLEARPAQPRDEGRMGVSEAEMSRAEQSQRQSHQERERQHLEWVTSQDTSPTHQLTCDRQPRWERGRCCPALDPGCQGSPTHQSQALVQAQGNQPCQRKKLAPWGSGGSPPDRERTPGSCRRTTNMDVWGRPAQPAWGSLGAGRQRKDMRLRVCRHIPGVGEFEFLYDECPPDPEDRSQPCHPQLATPRRGWPLDRVRIQALE